jgi:hypothetical protein
MRLRKQSADQVRFDAPIPLEVEVRAGLGSDEVESLAAQVAEAVRQVLRVRVQVEPLPAGSIPVGAYKNALTYVAEGARRP